MELPASGSMVAPSVNYVPVILRAVKIRPDQPLVFDFIVDSGDTQADQALLKAETEKLVKYFLASLTIPEKDLWVNLSPYEHDRVVPEAFGQTEMGRDLLAQDYILKQLTASLLDPEKEPGRAFWARVYARAGETLGTSAIPVDTFNKVWIIPDKAEVYEMGNTAVVGESRLKVLMEEDYLALQKTLGVAREGTSEDAANRAISNDVMHQVVIPEIEKEVNTGKNFALLRQVYQSLVLAAWYKNNLKESLLAQVYADQNKIAGVRAADVDKEEIYQRYIAAYKQGVFNYIREDIDPVTNEVLPRKYFSGGADFAEIEENVNDQTKKVLPQDLPEDVQAAKGTLNQVTVAIFAAADPKRTFNAEERHQQTHFPAMDEMVRSRLDEVQRFSDLYWEHAPVARKLRSGELVAAYDAVEFRDQGKKLAAKYVEKYPGSARPAAFSEVDALFQEFPQPVRDLVSRTASVFNPTERIEVFDALFRMLKAELDVEKVFDGVNLNMDAQEAVQERLLEVLTPFFLSEFKNDPLAYQQYVTKFERMMLAGGYTPLFLMAGKATRLGLGAMYGVDIEDVAATMGLPGVPDARYGLGMGPRQLVAYKVFLENLAKRYGMDIEHVMRDQKIVLAINDEVEALVFKDMEANNFYGFKRENVLFINQPQFLGQKLVAGTLREDAGSPEMVYGHGEIMEMLRQQGEFYTLNERGAKVFTVERSVLSALGKNRVASHRINDLTKFNPSTVVDTEVMAMALYLQEERGAGFVFEDVANPKRQKGSTPTNLGKLETLSIKSPELQAFMDEAAKKGAPYNAFRFLSPEADQFERLLSATPLRLYLRWYQGYVYLDSVTSDITQDKQARAQYVMRDGNLINDFKTKAEVPVALQEAVSENNTLQEHGYAPGHFKPTKDNAGLTGEENWRQGGIDFNPAVMNLKVSRTGQGIQVQVDPVEIQRIKTEGVNGFAPAIINIVPVKHMFPALGSAPAEAAGTVS